MGQIETELQKFMKGVTRVKCYREVVKIYAPTCHGKCLDAVNRLAGYLSEKFGGVTVYDAEGSWFDEERREVVKEPVKVLQSGHHCLSPEEATDLAGAILDYAKEAKQEAIAIHEGSCFVASREQMLKAYEKLREKKPAL